MSKFQLLSAYDSYVRPFLPQEDVSSDKGKGKQRDASPFPDPHSIHANDPDDDEFDRGKRKNSYKHLIKGIPGSITSCLPFHSFIRSTGKHSTKKDDFLTTIMQVPQKQRIDIVPFDPAIQRDAFFVGLDGLKGVSLIPLSIQISYRRRQHRFLVECEYPHIRIPASAGRQEKKGQQSASDHSTHT